MRCPPRFGARRGTRCVRPLPFMPAVGRRRRSSRTGRQPRRSRARGRARGSRTWQESDRAAARRRRLLPRCMRALPPRSSRAPATPIRSMICGNTIDRDPAERDAGRGCDPRRRVAPHELRDRSDERSSPDGREDRRTPARMHGEETHRRVRAGDQARRSSRGRGVRAAGGQTASTRPGERDR